MKVIIFGLPRSGTTLLGRIIAGVEGFHYEEEPNVIWRYQNYARLGHDQFAADHATPTISSYIRNYFDRSLVRNRASHLVEKTPANVLRGEFVLKVLPEAKVVILHRDREAILRSMVSRVKEGRDRNAERLSDDRLFRFLRIKMSRFANVPAVDRIAYMPQILSDLSGGRIYPQHQYWGPRPRGWEATLETSVEHRASLQVSEMVESLRKFSLDISENYLSLSYEALCGDTDGTLLAIEKFLGMDRGILDRSLVVGRA